MDSTTRSVTVNGVDMGKARAEQGICRRHADGARWEKGVVATKVRRTQAGWWVAR